MRRLVILAAALIIASQAAAGTIERVRETGVFRIGYRADAKPYSYQDSDGQPAGYIVDLCRQVAAALGPGVRTEYVLVHAGERFQSVHDGRVDILCDPSSVTLARREIVDFSLPTYLDGAGVLSRQVAPVQRFEDLAGKRVGVLIGTTTEEALARFAGGTRCHRHHCRRSATTVTACNWWTMASSMPTLPTAAFWRPCYARAAGPDFELSKQYFSYETYALALPRDDSAFRLLVDKTLARLYRTGAIDAILAKTFGHAPLDRMLKAMFVINALPEK